MRSSKETGLDDLTPDQLRAVAKNYREDASSSAFPATAASMLRLAERYEEMAADREAESNRHQ
jgi:hypothetical protein